MQIERDLAARIATWEIRGVAAHAFACTAEVIEYQCD
jgi:hypothetical protein